MMVVTTIVLPLETEKNVEDDSEGVGVGPDSEVVVEVEEDEEEVESMLELDEVEGGTEVGDDRDVKLSLEVLVGGGVVDVDGLSLGVDTEDELLNARK
jgi:hypothetical protein